MKKTITVLALIAVVIFSTSCRGRAVRRTAEATTMKVLNDTTKIMIDTDNIDSVKLIFPGEGDNEAVMSKSDYENLAYFLYTAIYDSVWNDSGIMVKMVAPDYTAVISYKDTPADHSDRLMVWKANGRAKFRQKWFFVAEDRREGLYALMEKYDNKGVVMTAYPERNGGAPQTLELTVKNNTDEVIQFGANYSIERLVEGKWIGVDLGNFAVIAIMYSLQPGGSGKYTINLFTESVKYPEGDYRVVKQINAGGGDSRPYYANFKVIEPR